MAVTIIMIDSHRLSERKKNMHFVKVLTAISDLQENEGIEVTLAHEGFTYQVIRKNGYTLIDSLNGIMLETEDIAEIKQTIVDDIQNNNYVLENIKALTPDEMLAAQYGWSDDSNEDNDAEDGDDYKPSTLHDIEEEEDFADDKAMGILYSYGRIDPANYCEGRFIAYKKGDVEKALDMGIKAIGLKKELKKSIAEGIIAAQIAKHEATRYSEIYYRSDATIGTFEGLLRDIGIDCMLLAPYGVMLDYQEYRAWIYDYASYAYEIVDGEEYDKRMRNRKAKAEAVKALAQAQKETPSSICWGEEDYEQAEDE